MKPTLILFFSIVCFVTLLKASPKNDWVLEIEKEGVRVYTQLDESSPYKQIKVTTTINASMDKVMEILMAFSNYKRWMYHVSDSYLVNQPEAETYYVFILEDADWPMQNRYQVSRLERQRSSTESSLHFRSVPNYIEKRTDAIQIKQSEGYWEVHDRPNHQCTLEYVIIQNPGGYVPPWLSNFHAVETPFNSVVKLKEMAEKDNIRP
ncbi:MAG: hypothetical protein IPP15_02085 [Saprospiraceae bacterium]|uniref:START domain-containing protein n=1 Tax=Candidatus Opimibacter skivensis TaxID=2982028 RepID=A0A9D7SSA6_9BACT|nr:hypothetical protein [Candidatus Opimibacter skivensis]